MPQLINKIKMMALALDPSWAERRYEKARSERGVIGTRDPDGTATLTLFGIDPADAAAVCGRLDQLARSAKNDGDRRPIDHLRADLSVWLQDGRFAGMTDVEVLAYLAATRPAATPQDEPMPERAVRAWIRRMAARQGCGTPPDDPAVNDPADAEPEPADAEPEPADAEPEPADAEPEPADSVPGAPEPSDAAPVGTVPSEVAWARKPLEPPRSGVELQVRVSTLMRMDDFPAELAGWGVIHPGLARSLAVDLGPAQWRYALTGPDGRLLAAGLTPVRPDGYRKRHWHCQAILELQIPATLLLELVSEKRVTVSAWMPVLADIVRRIGGIEVLTGERDHAPPDDGADDPTRRFARAGLRRDVQMRKRRCMGVGCRAPAGKLELDHTVDHSRGGPTIGFNLWPGCGHDHALKTRGGWTARAIDSDTLEWTSRLGHTYLVKTPPVIDPDLPDPAPEPHPDEAEACDPDPDRDLGGTPWQDSTCWYEPPPPSPRRRYIDFDQDEPLRPKPPPTVYPDEPPF